MPDQPEFDRVPVEPAEQFAGPEAVGLESALAVFLQMVGEDRVEQQGHMAEQVVEHVGLHDVIEFFGGADPVGDREPAVRQQGEKWHLGDQARHGDHLPSGGLAQPVVDLIEVRNPVLRAQRWQGADEFVAGQPGQHCLLPLVQAAVGVVVGRGVREMMLGAGVVRAGPGVVATWGACAGAIDNRFGGHVVVLRLRRECRLRAPHAVSGRVPWFRTGP